jgi:hypothetical protein
MIILTIGYRGTGKDTLYEQLKNPEYKIPFNWIIYENRDKAFSLDLEEIDLFPIDPNKRKIVQTALAKKLKLDILDKLKKAYSEKENLFPFEPTLEECDKHKNEKVLPRDIIEIDYASSELISYRDILIAYGRIMRESDKAHWCKAALKDHISELLSKDTFIDITDVRFNNEIAFIIELVGLLSGGKSTDTLMKEKWSDYFKFVIADEQSSVISRELACFSSLLLQDKLKDSDILDRVYPDIFKNIITIRVFRKEVDIPPFAPKGMEDSEHDLDAYQTTFLFVRDDLDFEEACKIFPQYKNYVRVSYKIF